MDAAGGDSRRPNLPHATDRGQKVMNSLKLPALDSAMPDIASNPYATPQGTLDWVGMANVHQPFLIREAGATSKVHGTAQVYVDLADSHAKGIHMSRLYLQLQEFAASEVLGARALERILAELVTSHEGLSNRALLEIRFDHFLRQQALKSDNSGWNHYPVRIRAQLIDGRPRLEIGVEVTYSSTCPCSAALARQLIQEQFATDFGDRTDVAAADVLAWLGTEQGILATPHSQRSVAEVLVQLADDQDELPLAALVGCVEGALKTPVQAAVKREDEQEFARLNGQNLMFCEDAGRRVKAALNADARILDFRVRVNHFESLHGHDAVAIVTKGVPDGYPPIA